MTFCDPLSLWRKKNQREEETIKTFPSLMLAKNTFIFFLRIKRLLFYWIVHAIPVLLGMLFIICGENVFNFFSPVIDIYSTPKQNFTKLHCFYLFSADHVWWMIPIDGRSLECCTIFTHDLVNFFLSAFAEYKWNQCNFIKLCWHFFLFRLNGDGNFFTGNSFWSYLEILSSLSWILNYCRAINFYRRLTIYD